MRRYYFHVQDGRDYPDLHGTLLETLDDVKVEAVRFAGDLLSHNGAKFWGGEEWSMRVTDAMDRTLFVFKFIAVETPTALDDAPEQAMKK